MKVKLLKCSICGCEEHPDYLTKLPQLGGALACEYCEDEMIANDIGDQLSGWNDEDEERR